MAHKPGKCDLRCPEAVQSAFLLHSEYGAGPEAIDTGVRMVESGNWGFAQYLQPADARRAIEPVVGEIARKQQRTGMWFRRDAEAHSYAILKALARADLLAELIGSGVFRYDPYQRFRGAPDEWGLLVRRNIMDETLDTDGALQAKLISTHGSEQDDAGSWGQTVSQTALVMERLLELGAAAADPHLTRGAQWLLSRSQERTTRRRPHSALEITVRDMITGPDCSAEHAAAGRFLSHHTLTRCCFVSIPIVQTALALRVLVRLGFEGDARVGRTFGGLLDMQTKTNEPMGELPPVPVGYWCAHQCRFRLEAREKANRRMRRTAHSR